MHRLRRTVHPDPEGACIWAKLYADVDELREAIAEFIERYNSQWLIERHGHRTPREVYAAWLEAKEAA